MRPGLACAVFASALSTAAVVHARSITYRAPDECPGEDEVAARLDAHEGRAALIEVTKEDGTFRGRVVVGDGEARIERNVEAKTCGAVVDALVLVVGLDRDVDPDDPEEEKAPPAPAPSPSVAPPSQADAPAPRAPSSRDARAEITFGAAWSVTEHHYGALVQSPSLFAGIDTGSGFLGTSWLVPSGRIAVGRSLSASTTTYAKNPGEDPEFVSTWAALDLCPFGFRATRALTLEACVRTDLGSIEARHADDEASAVHRFRAYAGGTARARVAFGSAETRPFVELSGGLLHDLVRDRFHFGEPVEGVRLILVSPWAGHVALSAGVALR